MRMLNKKKVLEAIEGSGGIIREIARKLGVDWHTAKRYINEWEETKTAYNNEVEIILDTAEETIFTAIKNGDIAVAKWVLLTKGKHRGYTQDKTDAQEDSKQDCVINLIVKDHLKTNKEVL